MLFLIATVGVTLIEGFDEGKVTCMSRIIYDMTQHNHVYATFEASCMRSLNLRR